MKLVLRTVAAMAFSVVFFGVALFVPAGTVDYWQAWVFIAVFLTATMVPSAYLAVRNPAALARRMKAGPTAETRPAQRIIMSATVLLVIAALVVSALDHRFGWSSVPLWLIIAGDVLVVGGLVLSQLVVVQNSYAAATITVEADQPLVSTGLYGVVRHPMYLGALIMMVGMPPALDSLWGLAVVAVALPVLAARILDEEKMLRQELPGYPEYASRVRKRLMPGVW
ncbi:membrane protein [Mycolicibacterium arabiense]|uniref:Membrane protein n=1 Tax=Mycolicibacterium arabiense TaxID=1286181 RepID=A0A7I7S7U1_9MYCO|nr:isoprenylcysteine carboxylmethyltransferase family protein [Mycolicibacterium arabiense]MCV7372751.1 isoprenylcysteine carboxylmethyltransferase family protein [Mycolicibacterium arabiense]BBY52075.1 membrane protein [Mycolicibacterium arabiense]